MKISGPVNELFSEVFINFKSYVELTFSWCIKLKYDSLINETSFKY